MTPEEFANSLFPESNWTGDEWKARRLKIAKLIADRDAEMRRVGAERMWSFLRDRIAEAWDEDVTQLPGMDDEVFPTLSVEIDRIKTLDAAAVAEGEWMGKKRPCVNEPIPETYICGYLDGLRALMVEINGRGVGPKLKTVAAIKREIESMCEIMCK